MADNKKAKRTPKTSAGKNRGAKRQRPPELLLISMNKGLAHVSNRQKPKYVPPAED